MLKWTKDHKSVCGRFWCYKAPRADEWQLFDKNTKDKNGNCQRYRFRHLADCKRYAEQISNSPVKG